MTHTDYSVVIATRNRADALALSLPLFLAQSRPPAAIFVIDSSDDPSGNVGLVKNLSAQTAIPLQHEVSQPGAALQRNIGLAQVTTEAVFFPDDDSLVHPGALEAMMRVYDMDTQGRVGGVCSAEARQPPEGTLPERAQTSYTMTRTDRLKARIARTRFAIEERTILDPFFLVAERAYSAQGIAPDTPAPDWMRAQDAIYVPWMTGFRMSFRTALIKRRGFNTHLGRYALFEDADACFDILRDHVLVGAREAQIYHHKAPTRRANGRAMGAMQILNRAYVTARAGHTDNAMRVLHKRFALYKIAQYAAGASSDFGRDRLAGAWKAYRVSDQIFAASPDALTQVYLALRASCFDSDA